MSESADPRQKTTGANTKVKPKRRRIIPPTIRERARNGLITGTAGAYLGSMIAGGGKSGYRGARVGALLGGLLGATNKGKRSGTVDTLATGGDWKFAAEEPPKKDWRDKVVKVNNAWNNVSSYANSANAGSLAGLAVGGLLHGRKGATPKAALVGAGGGLVARALMQKRINARQREHLQNPERHGLKASVKDSLKGLVQHNAVPAAAGGLAMAAMYARSRGAGPAIANSKPGRLVRAWLAKRARAASQVKPTKVPPKGKGKILDAATGKPVPPLQGFSDGRDRDRTLRDRVAMARDVAVIGGATAAGVGAVRGANALKRRLNDPRLRALVRTWTRAGRATAKGAQTVADAAQPMASVNRGVKAVGAKVGAGFRKVGTALHLMSTPNDEDRRQVRKSAATGAAVGALAGAAKPSGRRLRDGEPLKPGARYTRPHLAIPFAQHEGIATGTGTIAEVHHRSAIKGSGKTQIVPKEKFAKGMGLREVDKTGDAAAAARAKGGAQRVGSKQQKFKYCLLGNNCQHWTERMRTGFQPRISRQWRTVGKGAAIGGVAGASVAALSKVFGKQRQQARKTQFSAVVGLLGHLAGVPVAAKIRRPLFRALRRREVGHGASRAAVTVPEIAVPLATGAAAEKVYNRVRKKPQPQDAAPTTEFGGREQLADLHKGSYVDPFDVFTGQAKGYTRTQVQDYHRARRFIEDVKSGRRSAAPGAVRAAAKSMADIHAAPSAAAHGQVIRSVMHKANTVQRWSGRAGGLARDAAAHVQGKPRERDNWGREKKREWEKPWFQRKKGQLLTAAAIGGGALILRRNPGLQQKVQAAKANVQGRVNQKVKDWFPGAVGTATPPPVTRSSPGSVLKSVARPAAGGVKPKPAATQAVPSKVKLAGQTPKPKLPGKPPASGPKPSGKKPRSGSRGGQPPLTGLQTRRQRLTAFGQSNGYYDAYEAGWDLRDPRGNSARVFAPGSKGRERREKRWHEKLGNERKLWGAGLGLAALAGGGIAARVIKAKPSLVGAVPKRNMQPRAKVAPPKPKAETPPHLRAVPAWTGKRGLGEYRGDQQQAG